MNHCPMSLALSDEWAGNLDGPMYLVIDHPVETKPKNETAKGG
jgi:hypothetical protein